jgi:nitrogen regulatory protein PII
MRMDNRKLVTIVAEAALEAHIVRDIERLGAHGYTITEARGKGSRGVRDAGWDESRNIRVEVVCDEPVATSIAEHLRQHYYENYAMILFVGDVAVLRPEKF